MLLLWRGALYWGFDTAGPTDEQSLPFRAVAEPVRVVFARRSESRRIVGLLLARLDRDRG